MKANHFDLFSPEVLRLAKALNEQKNKTLAEHNLKGSNARCLCRVAQDREIGANAVEIAAYCKIDKAQTSRCMQELTAMGLVFRDDAQGRKYKQKYRLTEAGERVADDLAARALGVRTALGKGISEQEMAFFEQILEKLCRNYEACELMN